MNETSNSDIRVVLATGQGPLHYIESGTWIAKSGIRLRMILGWIPKRSDSLLCRLASRLIGRDLSVGFKRRMLSNAPFEIVTTGFSEVVYQCARRICSLFRIHPHLVDSWTWALLGLQSRSYLKGFNILQVRTGAGQGGLIKKAKRIGMKVIADHSALHPVTCEQNLAADYARWHQALAIGPGLGVWKNVESDCRQADIVVVNAEHIKESFVANGYSPDKIRVAYLGVRKDFLGLKDRYSSGGLLQILYTGAFSILKGAEYLLESMRMLHDRAIPFECTVIGNIDVPRTMLDRYEGLPIRFIGRLPQEELKSYLMFSDVYLFPSLADGCAKSGMEAMAAGLCVVATKTSGLPFEDGVSGYAITSRDAKSIADKLEWLASNPSEMERVGRAACALIREKYQWENYVHTITSIYKELLGK